MYMYVYYLAFPTNYTTQHTCTRKDVVDLRFWKPLSKEYIVVCISGNQRVPETSRFIRCEQRSGLHLDTASTSFNTSKNIVSKSLNDVQGYFIRQWKAVKGICPLKKVPSPPPSWQTFLIHSHLCFILPHALGFSYVPFAPALVKFSEIDPDVPAFIPAIDMNSTSVY